LLGTTLYWIAVPRIVLPGDPRRPEGTAAFPLFVGASAVALAFIWWGVLTDVYGSADRFGAFWFVSAFLGGVTLAIGFFGYYAERYRPPYALVILGFRRIPVVLLLVVWAAAGTFVDRNSNLHDVRIRRVAEEAPSRPLTTEQAFDNWVANNIAATNGTGTGAGDPTPAGAEKPAVPMVFVAASGGGIRAAAWTALVTDCLFGDHPAPQCQTAGGAWNRLFALSGASGGSVGLASAVAEHLARPSPNTHVLDRLRADLLGPSVAWQLFVEAPSALGRVNPGTDRGSGRTRHFPAATPRQPMAARPT
jgi:hypothetical protein